MDDVIFAGTPERSALGRSEVSLTIDNTAHLLPIEFTEVTITRTLFRDGESEYQINGITCRLLDIQELLSDTGIGRQQHVIVGQGQLDEVLTAQPGDRRAVIEEAAGVLKFRKRRERAERRLEATEGNLLRLNDLVREVGRQLRPLEKQADAARRYGGVEAEMRAIRLYLAGHEIAGRQTRLERLHDARNENAEKERLVRARLRELDRSVLDIEHSLTALGHDDAAEALVRAETMRERGRGLRCWPRSSAAWSAALTAAADEGVIETLVADADALRRELAEVDDESSALEPKLAEVEAAEQDLAAERARTGEQGDGTGACPRPRRGSPKPTSAGATPKPKRAGGGDSTPSTSRWARRARDRRRGARRPGRRRRPARRPRRARVRYRSGGRRRPGRRAPSRRARRRRRGPPRSSTSRPATRALVLVADALPDRCTSASVPVGAPARRVRSSAPAPTSSRCSSGSSPASCSWKADGGPRSTRCSPTRCRRRHPRRRPARRFGPVAPRQRDGTGGDPGRAGRRRRRSRRRRDGAPPPTELGPRRSRSKPSAPSTRRAGQHAAAVAELGTGARRRHHAPRPRGARRHARRAVGLARPAGSRASTPDCRAADATEHAEAEHGAAFRTSAPTARSSNA